MWEVIQKLNSNVWKIRVGKVFFIWALMLLYITVSITVPGKRFLENCDENITCQDEGPMVCATDGKNYTNKCFLEKENQDRFCKQGDFNAIAYVHDGGC